MEKLLLAGLALIGVVLGAFLQHHFGHLRGESERRDFRRNEAYSDYLRNASTIANSQMGEDRNFDFKLLSALADAKCRIAIYGSDEVIECLAAFEQSGAVLTNENSMGAFMRLAQAMRKEGGRKVEKATEAHLKWVLFGHD